jgi:predicted metal-dependent hydrolase
MTQMARRTHMESLIFQEREVIVRRRPYRRTVGVTLRLNGQIQVSAPACTSLAQIHQFLTAHQDWIERTLGKYQTLRQAHPQKTYARGERFPFLGEKLVLDYQQGRGERWGIRREGERLVIDVPAGKWASFAPEQAHIELAPLVARFFEASGRQILSERLKVYSARMQLAPTGVSFRSQKTRWGSCSGNGRISLNWRLVFAPLEVVDYVVAHELAHLRHHNHSAAFWALVATQIPEPLRCRRWLRDHLYDSDFLARQSELHAPGAGGGA